jgi:hypothetical protein
MTRAVPAILPVVAVGAGPLLEPVGIVRVYRR